VPQKTNSRDFCAGLPPRERPRHRTAEHTEIMRVASCPTPGSGCIRLRYSKSAKSGGRCLIRSPHGTPGVTESIAIVSRPGRTGQLVCRRANQQKPVQPPLQKYFCFPKCKSGYMNSHPVPHKRGVAQRHQRGAGCGGRGGALGRRALRRTAKSCGPDTPTLVSSSR